jgi:hypothetical protein
MKSVAAEPKREIKCPFCDSTRVCEATRISNGTLLRCATLGCETLYSVADDEL